MTTAQLPKLETIRKYVHAPGTALPVEKNGIPVSAEGNVRAQWMDVTPETASRWLRNNFRNRPVSDDVVAAYARDMVNGVWQPTHQGIAFNDRDELIDGQHRLKAVIKSRKTIRMMVTFGLPSKIEGSEMTTMDCVDRGRTRSVADQLKIQHGLKNSTAITQIASGIAGLCHERVRRLSVGQTLDIYREFKVPMDFIITNRSKEPGLKSAGVLSAFTFVMRADDAADFGIPGGPAATMFKALNSGEGLKAFPVIKLFREFLTGNNASLILASMNRGIAELAVQALFLELKKERVTNLKFSLDGLNHFRAAQPERVGRIAKMFALPDAVDPAKQPVKKSALPRIDSHVCDCGKAATVNSRGGWRCVRCHMIETGGKTS